MSGASTSGTRTNGVMFGGVGGADQVRGAIQIERAVLHVDDDEIKPRRRHHLDHHRAAGKEQHARDGFAIAQEFADAILEGHERDVISFAGSGRDYRARTRRVKVRSTVIKFSLEPNEATRDTLFPLR